jgi:CRP-like cAMP-binding protein
MVDTYEHLVVRIPLFAPLAPEDQRAIARLARLKTYRARQVVFRQGDPGDLMFAILSGHLKVVAHSADGRDTLLSLMRPGEVFGELSVLDGARRSATVTAIAATQVLIIDRRSFLGFLRTSPDTAIHLLGVLAERVRRLSDEREDIASLDVSARLVKKIVELATHHGQVQPRGEVRIALRLSQRDLGAWVGATRESVNKFLRHWGRERVLRFEDGHIVVSDLKKLQSVAMAR